MAAKLRFGQKLYLAYHEYTRILLLWDDIAHVFTRFALVEQRLIDPSEQNCNMCTVIGKFGLNRDVPFYYVTDVQA